MRRQNIQMYLLGKHMFVVKNFRSYIRVEQSGLTMKEGEVLTMRIHLSNTRAAE